MKKNVKAAIALLLLACLLCGCTGNTTPSGSTGSTPPAATEGEYTVSVVDANGEAYTSGVIVQILKDGEQVLMQPVNDQGKVSKVLPFGDYTVVLKFTSADDEYYYDESSLTLSAEKTQLQVQLIPYMSGTPLRVSDGKRESDAYEVLQGSTYVTMEKGQRCYFLFAAKTAGTYRITTSDPNATVGVYGYTAYIQANSIAPVENNVITLPIYASMVGATGMSNPYVIGIDAGALEGCVLTIERIGDPPYSIEEDEPWIIYKPTVELKPYVLPEGTIQEFDLTADGYTLVFNETDGFYHLNTADGPLVLVRLYSETKWLMSFAEITSTTGIKKYFYDADGKFVKREDYTQCLKDYCEMSDEVEGVYPLTEDLKYILQNHGEHAGWWEVDGPGFLFRDENGNRLVGLNPEIAWLFACCYLEQ